MNINTQPTELESKFDLMIKMIDQRTQLLALELSLLIENEFSDIKNKDTEKINQCKNKVYDYLTDTLPSYNYN